MPTPAFTTSQPVTTHVHEVVTNRTLDWVDCLTILLPVIIPVLTFRLGYTMNRREENRKEKQRLYEVKIYFLTLAKFLAEVVDAQAKVILDAATMVQLMTDTNISAGIYPELNTRRIKAIPDLDLYKIFIIDRKTTIEQSTGMLNKLSSALDSIDNIKIRLEQHNAEIIKEIMLYIERYTNVSNLLADENAEMSKQNTLNSMMNDLEFYTLNVIYAQCSAEFAARVKDENIAVGDITKRYEFLIKPMFERTRGIKETKGTYNMLNNIAKLNYDYSNFLLVKAAATSIFNDLAINCKNISAEINLIYESLPR